MIRHELRNFDRSAHADGLRGGQAVATGAVVTHRAVPAVVQQRERLSCCRIRTEVGRRGPIELGHSHHAGPDDGIIVWDVELATVLRSADQNDSGTHGREPSTPVPGVVVLLLIERFAWMPRRAAGQGAAGREAAVVRAAAAVASAVAVAERRGGPPAEWAAGGGPSVRPSAGNAGATAAPSAAYPSVGHLMRGSRRDRGQAETVRRPLRELHLLQLPSSTPFVARGHGLGGSIGSVAAVVSPYSFAGWTTAMP